MAAGTLRPARLSAGNRRLMAKANRDRGKEIQDRIRQVLLHEWDPIGVRDVPEAQDEYDSYVGGVYRLLASGASEDEIVDHLWNIETVIIGLPGLDRTKLLPIARRLCGLDVEL